jgi:hypothetical protein
MILFFGSVGAAISPRQMQFVGRSGKMHSVRRQISACGEPHRASIAQWLPSSHDASNRHDRNQKIEDDD